MPVDLHEARGREAPPLLAATIVAAHLAALDALARRTERVCMITDMLQREEDRAGRQIDALDLMYGIGLPPPDAAWG